MSPAPPNAGELCKESTPDDLRLVMIGSCPKRYGLKSGGLTSVASVAADPVVLSSQMRSMPREIMNSNLWRS